MLLAFDLEPGWCAPAFTSSSESLELGTNEELDSDSSLLMYMYTGDEMGVLQVGCLGGSAGAAGPSTVLGLNGSGTLDNQTASGSI